MKTKKVLIWVAVALFAVMGMIMVQNAAQGQAADQTVVLSKLDQVLDNQKSMMQSIEALKQELNIIKIRITQSQ